MIAHPSPDEGGTVIPGTDMDMMKRSDVRLARRGIITEKWMLRDEETGKERLPEIMDDLLSCLGNAAKKLKAQGEEVKERAVTSLSREVRGISAQIQADEHLDAKLANGVPDGEIVVRIEYAAPEDGE